MCCVDRTLKGPFCVCTLTIKGSAWMTLNINNLFINFQIYYKMSASSKMLASTPSGILMDGEIKYIQMLTMDLLDICWLIMLPIFVYLEPFYSW